MEIVSHLVFLTYLEKLPARYTFSKFTCKILWDYYKVKTLYIDSIGSSRDLFYLLIVMRYVYVKKVKKLNMFYNIFRSFLGCGVSPLALTTLLLTTVLSLLTLCPPEKCSLVISATGIIFHNEA
uniref:Uncharacterized protein n=1 Tax=Cacopsylla melanoneura TaxID=428564 RepID=A0A8D8ZJQ1_9HEMI